MKKIYELARHILNALQKNKNIVGDFSTYGDALIASGGMGYTAGNANLIEYVKQLKSKDDGTGVWAWTTLSGIYYSAITRASPSDPVYVVDFGGGYGETWFQLSNFLNPLPINWNVIELDEKVEIARRAGFEDEVITFNNSEKIDCKIEKLDCLLLGGVLQYLEDPYHLLEDLLEKKPKVVVVDRTPMRDYPNNSENFYVQKSPNRLGGSSHPLRILNVQRVQEIFQKKGYEKMGEYDYGAFPHFHSKGRYLAQIWKYQRLSAGVDSAQLSER
jgi:putative methyltransferase (TIGR04325 family)